MSAKDFADVLNLMLASNSLEGSDWKKALVNAFIITAIMTIQ